MLATGWKVVNDTTWEFTLRQGVKFHNGEPFNAQSVKATMDYIKDPANKSHYLPRWAQVKEVQVVNDYTVRFVTDKPWPGLIDRMAATDFLPMPPKALEGAGRPGARPPSRSAPGRSSSSSGRATRSSCSRRTPTTGRARPISTA